jgi:hypothetical protein
MKRLLTVVAVAGLSLFAVYALADDKMAGMKMAAKPAKTMSWTGEIVDTGCYLAHEAKGEKHVECGAKCVANGMPMGLLTKEGKLYLLTVNHDNADPYNQCKGWVGSQVEVSGTMMERAGMKGIDVTGAKAMAAAVAK